MQLSCDNIDDEWILNLMTVRSSRLSRPQRFDVAYCARVN
jgi:hypothetical protein